MRVLILTESYPTPEHPGRGIFLKRQAEALASRHEVEVLFPRPTLPLVPSSWIEPAAERLEAGIEPPSPVPVVRPRYVYVPRNRRIRIRSLQRLTSRRVGECRADIIHAHWISPAGTAAVRAARRARVAAVVTAHAGDVYRELGRSDLRRLARESLLQAQRVVHVAAYFRPLLLDLGVPPERLVHIPNGVDVKHFRPAADPSALRRRLGWPEDKWIFCYAGNLSLAKGAASSLQAFLELNEPETFLVLAGTGPNADALEHRIRAAGATNRVKLAGWYPHQAMPDILGAADAFVLFSSAEGNPVTVLESLCCGTPVIGSDIAAIAELVTSTRDGILAPAGDVTALTAAMRVAVRASWDRRAIATAAASRYGWSRVVSCLDAAYSGARAEAKT